MEELFEQERIVRLAGDTKKLSEIQHTIISECKSDNEIITTLRLLINKRKQEPECIKKLIKTVFDQHRDVDFLKQLLERVIEGRIFLEDERMDIAEYVKNTLGNNIHESYIIVKDIPVETFTTISDRKRNRFLFEQFRLALLLKKLDDAELISRKVRRNYLTDEEKTIFLNYNILLRVAQNRLLDASALFLELNEIDTSKKHVTVGSLYCLMSSCLTEDKYCIEEKRALMKKFYEFKDNDEAVRMHLKRFCSDLIIDFVVTEQICADVAKYDVKADEGLMRTSIMEHNLFVISKFFSKIRLVEMAGLMQITEDVLISFVSEMVNEKFCDAKINQQQGLVFFGNKHWNESVDGVLDKIVYVSHLIHKYSLSES